MSIDLILNKGGHPHLIEGGRHGHEGIPCERHPIARSAVAARQGDKVRAAEAPPGLTVPGNRACRVALSDLERSNYRLKPCDRRLRLHRLGRGDRSLRRLLRSHPGEDCEYGFAQVGHGAEAVGRVFLQAALDKLIDAAGHARMRTRY